MSCEEIGSHCRDCCKMTTPVSCLFCFLELSKHDYHEHVLILSTNCDRALSPCRVLCSCTVLNSGVRLTAICGTLSLLFSARWMFSYCLQDACHPRFPLGAIGPEHLPQKKCHTKRNNASMVRLCALTPWLYGLLFMRDFAVHNSIKRSLIPELWYLFPKTARNFSAMWKPPKQKTVSRNSPRYFQTICLAFQSPDQRWQPHPSDQDWPTYFDTLGEGSFPSALTTFNALFEVYLMFWTWCIFHSRRHARKKLCFHITTLNKEKAFDKHHPVPCGISSH